MSWCFIPRCLDGLRARAFVAFGMDGVCVFVSEEVCYDHSHGSWPLLLMYDLGHVLELRSNLGWLLGFGGSMTSIHLSLHLHCSKQQQ